MNKLKVGTRLSLGFGCVCLLLVVTIGVGLSKVAMLNDGTTFIVHNKLPKIEQSHILLEQVDASAIAARNMMLNDDPADRQRQIAMIQASRKTAAEMLDLLNKAMVTPDGQAIMRSMQADRQRYESGQDKQVAMILAGKLDEAKTLSVNELRPALAAYKGAMVKMVERQTAQINDTAGAAQQAYIDARNQMIGIGVFALLAASAIGVMITRGLLKQLGGEPDYAADIAAQIAAGNLGVSVAVGANDRSSLIFAMESMRAQLAGVVRDVRAST
ncbi:MAG: MCP four helix bundle domain-containing protein, partial [Pseudomonadota bacterium]|nr:MCP four helix bundle domain-containing protein [Pseudomonadota bacterium]